MCYGDNAESSVVAHHPAPIAKAVPAPVVPAHVANANDAVADAKAAARIILTNALEDLDDAFPEVENDDE